MIHNDVSLIRKIYNEHIIPESRFFWAKLNQGVKRGKWIPGIIWYMSNDTNYIVKIPNASPAIRQIMLTAHTHRKECLM